MTAISVPRSQTYRPSYRAAQAEGVREPNVSKSAADLLTTLSALPAQHPSRRALRDQVIEAFLPLAQHLANRFGGRGEPIEDLVQTATVGLIKAVDKFDPSRGAEFPAYAIPTIIGEIKRHFRDRTWDIRVPRRLQELRLDISEATSTLLQELGRSPTVADIAQHLELTEEEVLEGLEGARAYNAVSLSARTSDGDQSTELGDLIGADDNEYELAELRVALGPAMATLDEREQRILTLRFYGNMTQSQIAEQVGVSQMHVSRLLARALVKLRGQLTECGQGAKAGG
jgi:RNA polymerase sigma-B factor